MAGTSHREGASEKGEYIVQLELNASEATEKLYETARLLTV